ncbi:MAG: hypothetical protein LQ352_004904 [Teloschistes flavicans]|nr:MAG: hypothetical protein LQ352_004904 [Teloschistes flavicans]
MGREEQIEEREVLDSIFPDEITDIDEKSYRIAIKPQIQDSDGSDTEPPTLLLTIIYPPSYPDEAPLLDLSLPPNAPKPPHLDLPTDRRTLLSSLDQTISESLGMAMIFTLVTTLTETIENLITSRIVDIQKEKDREVEEAEAKENAKFHGERVTRESFLRWREGFRAEMEKRLEEEERVRKEGEGKRGAKREERLTGRDLWEKGMVGKEMEEEEEGLEEGVEGLRFG